MTEISASNQIQLFMHCAKCLNEKPDGISPEQYQSITAGWTVQGLQVWCKRHEINIVHIDFEGQQHPANTEEAN